MARNPNPSYGLCGVALVTGEWVTVAERLFGPREESAREQVLYHPQHYPVGTSDLELTGRVVALADVLAGSLPCPEAPDPDKAA